MPPSTEWSETKFMAGDAHDLLNWKRWIVKEDVLSRSASSVALTHKPLLHAHMDLNGLNPSPAWAAASCHLRGRPRHEWARYAGEPTAGYDPVVGYNMRWAKARNPRKSAPFSQLRSASSSNLALSAALAPLNIKPVERLPPRRLPTPPDLTLHRVKTLEDLAPDIEERRSRKVTEVNVHDSSQMAVFMAAHAGR